MPRENEGKASLQKNFRRRHEREQHFELQSALVDKILFREVWKSKLWIETWWQSLHLLWNTRIKVSNFDHKKKLIVIKVFGIKVIFFRFLKKYLEKSTFFAIVHFVHSWHSMRGSGQSMCFWVRNSPVLTNGDDFRIRAQKRSRAFLNGETENERKLWLLRNSSTRSRSKSQRGENSYTVSEIAT